MPGRAMCSLVSSPRKVSITINGKAHIKISATAVEPSDKINIQISSNSKEELHTMWFESSSKREFDRTVNILEQYNSEYQWSAGIKNNCFEFVNTAWYMPRHFSQLFWQLFLQFWLPIYVHSSHANKTSCFSWRLKYLAAPFTSLLNSTNLSLYFMKSSFLENNSL